MIKLGMIGAMEPEVALLRGRLEDPRAVSVCGRTFYEGRLNGLPVVVVVCGVGKVNAALCVQILADRFGVSHLLNTGIAGSLDPSLDIGDLVVSQDAMYHDFDVTAFGYPKGQVAGLPVAAFPADETLRALALRACQSVHPGHCRTGRIASGDQFICRAEQKREIISVTGAVCTEMEGAAIAQAAYLNSLPFVILRAISDKADESAQMDYPTFEHLAAQRSAAVAEALAGLLAETK